MIGAHCHARRRGVRPERPPAAKAYPSDGHQVGRSAYAAWWLAVTLVRDIAAAFWLSAFALLLGAIGPDAAEARSFVGLHFGVGVPLVVGPTAYYYPPPVYYYPPPPPVFYPQAPAPPSSAASANTTSQQVCHEYQTTALIDVSRNPPGAGLAYNRTAHGASSTDVRTPAPCHRARYDG
jgi:hypothetical protein